MATLIVSYIGAFVVSFIIELLVPPLGNTFKLIGIIIFVGCGPFIFFKLGKIVRLWGDRSK